jgi:hypothetical protein
MDARTAKRETERPRDFFSPAYLGQRISKARTCYASTHPEFWSAGPHLVVEETLVYPRQNAHLDRQIVIADSGVVKRKDRARPQRFGYRNRISNAHGGPLRQHRVRCCSARSISRWSIAWSESTTCNAGLCSCRDRRGPLHDMSMLGYPNCANRFRSGSRNAGREL